MFVGSETDFWSGVKRYRLKPILLFVFILTLLLWGAFQLAQAYFLGEVAERGRAALALHVEHIRVWLGRYQALPRIYAKSTEIRAALRDPGDSALVAEANHFLVDANFSTGAADSYLLDPTGKAIAASNWDDKLSFVGRSYSYRPYFQDAMQGRLGRFFALGAVSGKRGYYFAHPVREANRVVGVVVVKVGVDEIEVDLRASPQEVLVSDHNGVVIFSGHPDWRLASLVPLSEDSMARMRRDRQFGDREIPLINWVNQGLSPIGLPWVDAVPDHSDRRPRRFLVLTAAMPLEGWTAYYLVRTADALRQSVMAAGLVLVVLVTLTLLALVIRERRRRYEERLAATKEVHERLERAVQERTADLSAANRQLAEEVNERKAAEDELRHTQTELIQAGKLAALGQMSAALSHEFNQPLTAIRSYSDNAIAFLERGREEEAQTNIRHVSALTERMAALSKHLSSFARKPRDKTRPVSLTEALKETLALLQGRLEKFGIEPRLVLPSDEIWVIGGHIRLQQVIMNLITNAIDATRDLADPDLKIEIQRNAEETRLIVEDNGEGLESEQLGKIFDPFYTTKGVGQGLGLGLSISYNIIKDFDGTISASNLPQGGARFVVTLKTATASVCEARQ